jgi:uncharacterized protein (TIGR03437 family)
VAATANTTPATLTISANANGLAAGTYTGTVNVSVPGSPAETITVTLGVGVTLPTVNAGGIVNGASFSSLMPSGGEIVSVFGTNLGTGTGVNATASGGSLPKVLGGVQVFFDGNALPLFYESNGQVNLEVPFEVGLQSSTSVQIRANNVTGAPFTLMLRSTDPGIFMANGRATIMNSAGVQITPSNPAQAGQTLSIYATGLGAVSGSVSSGQLIPIGTLFNTTNTATVTVNGMTAPVSFSGLAPTFTGLYQINFTVPAGLSSGDQPLVLSIGGNATSSVALAIQ